MYLLFDYKYMYYFEWTDTQDFSYKETKSE